MRRLLPFVTLAATLAASAAMAAPPVCPAGLRPAQTAELIFGRNVQDIAPIPEADWRRFVAAEITPRFPRGLDAPDVYSQWEDPKGAFEPERTKALVVVLTDDRVRRALNDVGEAYKQRFHQHWVTLMVEPACVAF
ncbi:MAG TPA: DUF3574 domain-containing protein [Caulobacteraceae bacterium]|nr:DUF3574 domain-containing protein [Caulobacteraceae bacterium]